MSATVRFGSVAASQQFTSPGAAIGHKRTVARGKNRTILATRTVEPLIVGNY